ncbi:MAG: hypothetical protein IJK18_00340 [Clostridia bacterium]|nr:hypothetical protein [Clostridia bacterium]
MSKENIKSLLEGILKKEIDNVDIEGIEHFESIIEYDFSLLKAKILFKNSDREEVYLRLIKGGKIKESIFCFWSILYEEYLQNKEREIENAVQKAIITQIMSEENVSSLLLTIDSRLNYCAEVSLVELKKFLEKNQKERWLGSLEVGDNDILFIGKKMY